jgi:hypothetical protein
MVPAELAGGQMHAPDQSDHVDTLLLALDDLEALAGGALL